MTNARILNVDDHDAGRYAITRSLSRAGFEVEEAATGEEALRMVSVRRPDIVLLDVNLPDIDGFEVCRRIKNDPESSRLPVIFLSASRLEDLDVAAGLNHGGDHYLREPIDPTILVATVRALLRVKEAEDALIRSNEQLRRFAFVVSHELQEPLRMVKSYTQLLSQRHKSVFDAEASEFIHYTITGVNRMEKFIHDMLSYSQAAEAEVELKEFASRTALDWALMELGPAISESHTTVHIEELPTVIGDASRLSQVFKNLIGNAIKYRADRPPVIRVSAVETAGEHIFSIQDNGIGIDSRYFDNIFVLFKRLHGQDRSGSGVGLAVCKEIIERHSGRIWVSSDEGQGSNFYFSLPKHEDGRLAATT